MSLPGRLTGLLIASGLTLAAGIALAPASSAAPVTTLSFTPASGLDITPMYVIVPQPCPEQASNVIVTAVGSGFPAGGQPVVNNSTSGISHTAPFILPLQDTFNGFAAINGAKLRGSYALTLRCINRLDQKTYASFSGTVTFSDATHFTAPAPARSVIAAIAASQVPVQDPTQPAATASAQDQPQASVSARQSAPSAAAQSTVAPRGVGPATKSVATSPVAKKSNDVWQPVLIIAALLLIAGAIVLRALEVRRERRRAGLTARKTAAVESPSVSVDEILNLPSEEKPAKADSSPRTRA